MGANHINEIGFLCQIAKINYGLITNIGKAHLEGFENYENIIKTKNELYEYIRSTSNTVFVNQKDPLLLDLSSQINRVLYNQYTEVTENEFVTLNIENQKVQTQLIGSYNIPNIIAAYTIGKFFKVEKNCIADAISKYKPTNNRSELKKTNLNNTLILDAYNANPSSMSLAINSFIKTKSENSILILGDMLELGKNSLSEHQKIIDLLNETQNLKIILVGREFKSCKHSFLQFLNTQELKSWILKNKIENSKILLKGSRGIKLEELEPSL
jgi:UDP-N-acetylmuramoyl-tripeptide--D-alanyl-D-alanine ligase